MTALSKPGLNSRVHEGRVACLPELTDKGLVDRHRDLEDQTHMVSAIDSLNVAKNVGHLKKDSILKKSTDGMLHIFRYPNFPAAMRDISRIENQTDTENAVLVGAATPSHIRDAFRNYFDDTSDFVELLNDAIRQIDDSNLGAAK